MPQTCLSAEGKDRMTRRPKLVVLLAVAALAMTALTLVNWQASQDTGPRRPAISAPGYDRWTVS